MSLPVSLKFDPAKEDYGFVSFRDFNNSEEGEFQFYGVRDRFKHGCRFPEAFLESYKRRLLYEVTSHLGCASVVASLNYARAHAVVVDLDAKPKILDPEGRIRVVVDHLMRLLRPADPHIYVMAKVEGGPEAGLHFHVPNVYLSRLDYLVLVESLAAVCPECDVGVTCWSLPLSSKTGEIDGVYLPFRVYGKNVVTVFSREDYVDTFAGISRRATDDGVWHFETVVDDNEDDAVAVVKRSTVSSASIGKRLDSLLPGPTDHSEFRRFDERNPCNETRFKNFPWHLYYDRAEDIVFADGWLRENMPLPLTFADLYRYARRDLENAFKLCFALHCTDPAAAPALAAAFRVGEFLPRVAEETCTHSLSALVVDVLASTEPDESPPGFESARRCYKQPDVPFRLPALALTLMGERDVEPAALAPFVVPASSSDKRRSLYVKGRWKEYHGSGNVSGLRHFYMPSFTLLLAAHRLVKGDDKKKENEKESTVDSLKDDSLCFWQDFEPRNPTFEWFVFGDNAVYDFAADMLIKRPLLLWRVNSSWSSCLHSSVLPPLLPPNVKGLYFNRGGDEALRSSHPRAHDFLTQVFGGDLATVDFFVDIVADAVAGEERKRVYYLFGETSNNGKSLTLKMLLRLFGTQAARLRNYTLTKGFSETNGDLLDASNAKIMVVDEAQTDAPLNSNVIKLISGQTTTKIRGLYKDPAVVEFRGVLVLAGNGCVSLEMTDAIVGRFYPLHFPIQFLPQEVEDEEMEEDEVKVRDPHVVSSRKFKIRDLDAIATDILLIAHGRVRLGERRPRAVASPAVLRLKADLIKQLENCPVLLEALGYTITGSEGDRVHEDALKAAASKQQTFNKKRIDPIDFCQRVKRLVLRYEKGWFYGLAERDNLNFLY